MGNGQDPDPGAALARGWLENSPFVAHLGIALESMEPDRARLRLPYSERLPTMGEVVHGGAGRTGDRKLEELIEHYPIPT